MVFICSQDQYQIDIGPCYQRSTVGKILSVQRGPKYRAYIRVYLRIEVKRFLWKVKLLAAMVK